MQLTDFISLFNVLLVLLYSVHLLFSFKGNKLLNQLLAIFFLGKAVTFVLFRYYVEGIKMIPSFLIFPFGALFFLTPSIFYLYIRSFIGDEKKLRQSDWWHLLPVITIFIFQLLFKDDIVGKNSWNVQLNQFFNFQIFGILKQIPPRLVFILVYLILSWRIVLKAGKKGFPFLHKKSKNWILFLMSLSTLQLLLSIPPLFILLTNNMSTYNYQIGKMMLIGDSILFILVIYAMRNPVVLYGYLVFEPIEKMGDASLKLSEKLILDDKLIINRKLDDESPSPLVLDNILESVNQYMTEKKPWLKANYDISQMASDLGKPVHHCSYILNEGLKISFRDCINRYRIQYFIEKYPTKMENIT